MSAFPDSRPAQPPRPWLMLLLCGIYLLTGVVGHDPWKSEDAQHLGVAWGIFNGEGWLVPRIGGEPWIETTPAWHWVAAILARLTSWALPFHDGARLATPLFGALLLLGLHRAAGLLHGHSAALVAPLLAVGTLGLLMPSHLAHPAIAVLAATVAAFIGLALLPRQPAHGTAWLALGVGGAFFIGGLGGVAPLLPLLLLPAVRRQWLALFFAIYLSLAVASIWPTLLALRIPEHLTAWWRHELGGAAPRLAFSADHLKLLGWFTWPLWPVAAWSAWYHRQRWRDWSLLVPMVGTLSAMAWFFTHEARPLNAMPLVVPLCLLAAAGVDRLRRGAAGALDWFGMMTFTLVTGLVWLGTSAMLAGWPPKIARNFTKLAPGFVAEVSAPALLAGLAITAVWALLLIRLPRSPWRAAARWAGGVTVMWALVTALWLPWIDHGRTYRSAATGLRKAIGQDSGCIARSGLGTSQRASLDYFAGIRTLPRSAGAGCRWLLAQEGSRKNARPGWAEVWEGGRPGDRRERLRLYRRD
ncbi:MAG: hypothetical protein OHM77_04900 [Candidatus Nitricoxidivorans perseverans]|uniref:Glycosyltransferase RgtA/B/C/D-like domain-containing protein n=1 Tax=Candidatus Nitricoxidivorans perseverans TaxID=2975601 RepID=A0AA49FM68_9PROT|nr:MAG: hypothetical protein OHM77_04900 [Candidatus Nitricoxidivorans perseverans]